ncbi:MAG: copper homeostasis protein CutC [Bacteroidota bacterium]
MLVEVCANSLESALNAQEAGADRIELCSELGVGGITPSAGLLELVKKQLQIPVHVLIRPRSGHFSYTNHEIDVMLADIDHCRSLSVEGVVVGALKKDFTLDDDVIKTFKQTAGDMKVVFHRAFDWVDKPIATLEQLENMGIHSILTSGQTASAVDGLELLKELHSVANNVIIMAGGGVDPENAHKFKEIGLQAVHLSGTVLGESISLEGKIPMNSSKHLREDRLAVTKPETIRQMVRSVK